MLIEIQNEGKKTAMKKKVIKKKLVAFGSAHVPLGLSILSPEEFKFNVHR